MSGPLSPVYAILKNASLVDYSGHLSMVLFTSGCNLACGYCHNAILRREQPDRIAWGDLQARCDAFRANWADAAVITGGEPTLSPDLPELIARLKSRGFAVKLDTNGTRPDVLAALLTLVDYVALDVKCSLARYPELTGLENPAAIRESVHLIRARARDYEFRTTVIDAWHTDEEMLRIGELVRGARRYVLQPFAPREDILDTRFREMPRTPPGRLNALAQLMTPFAGAIEVRGA